MNGVAQALPLTTVPDLNERVPAVLACTVMAHPPRNLVGLHAGPGAAE